jgi:hypothetical protein
VHEITSKFKCSSYRTVYVMDAPLKLVLIWPSFTLRCNLLHLLCHYRQIDDSYPAIASLKSVLIFLIGIFGPTVRGPTSDYFRKGKNCRC